MNTRILPLALVCAVLYISSLASSQMPSGEAGASAPLPPYTAEFHTTRQRTLANGATITREAKELMARDSQGRTVTATTQIPAVEGDRTFTNIHVNLPDRTIMSWNSDSKQVRVIHMRPLGSTGCWSSVPAGLRDSPAASPALPASSVGSGSVAGTGAAGVLLSSPSGESPSLARRSAAIPPVREELGTDAILGVEVKGTRIARTTPVGRIGNDVPLVHTLELWTAPSLGGLVLREVTDDPQIGKSTREVVSLDLNEPDPGLFVPPADYEMVDENMHQVPCQAGR
jgi:hypothetical protein